MSQIQQADGLYDSSADHVKPRGRLRWSICALLFFCTAINYIDRQILGILKPQLSHDLHWNDRDYANIVTVFQCAYACGYLFGGRLMDRFGVKRGLPAAAFLWSIAAAAHGFVRSVFGFSVARLGLGLAEGGNFPAAIRVVCDWFPIRERALATGIFNSASNVGAIVCPLTIPWIAAKAGWQMAFFVTGALGLAWVVAWKLLYETPDRHKGLTESERVYIESGRQELTQEAVPWLAIVKLKSSWAYILASAFTGPVWWFYLFWIPDFLHRRFTLSLVRMGFFTSVIYMISIVGSVGGGWLAQRLLNAGWSVNAARKTALLVPAVCVLPVSMAASVHDIWIAVVVVGVAAAAHQAFSANLYTLASDTMPKRAVSSLVGLGGFASGIAAMVVAQAVGIVLTLTGSYVTLFVWASGMYLVSVGVVHALVPRIAPAGSEFEIDRKGN